MESRICLLPLGSGSAANDHTNRRRIVSIARVVHLRAVRKDGEYVAFGTQVDVMSGVRRPGGDTGFANVIDGHAHEKVDVAYDVSLDRKSTRLNSSHGYISYAVFCLKKKKCDQLSHSVQHSRLHNDFVMKD